MPVESAPEPAVDGRGRILTCVGEGGYFENPQESQKTPSPSVGSLGKGTFFEAVLEGSSAFEAGQAALCWAPDVDKVDVRDAHPFPRVARRSGLRRVHRPRRPQRRGAMQLQRWLDGA